MSKKILIIDDDVDLCMLLSRLLIKKGFETEVAHSGQKGVNLYSTTKFDAVICDYRLGDMDGIKLIGALKEVDPDVAILVITGYSDIKTAVEVIKLGAFDYITKPLIPDEVLATLHKLIDKRTEDPESTNGVKGPKKNPAGKSELDFYKGQSAAAVRLYEQAALVSGTNYSVVLYGESGTGKEVIAQRIHELSHRNQRPFVALDCGTLSKELAGSELFGHVKGAFTGALQDKEGHFEMAEGGTLFLDEVGNLSTEVQATLLRVIQERKFKRVGGTKVIPTDVRIIVASNENLKEAYQRGRFREDLYHRFNEFSIHLPPLRERKDDIIPLADFFLQQTIRETGKNVRGFDPEVLNIFLQYPWPGNLREFRNVVRRALLLTEAGALITLVSLPSEIVHYKNMQRAVDDIHEDIIHREPDGERDILKGAAAKAEFDTIMTVLQQVNFNKKKAAEVLKIDRKTLYNKLKMFQSMQQP